MLRKIAFLILSVIYFMASNNLLAQVSSWQETRRGALYFSCGYNYYTDPACTIHIEQAELNSSYDLMNVKTQKNATNASLSIMNLLNYNVGYFFNYNQTWALEICYIPINLYAIDNQKVQLKGIKEGVKLDTAILLSAATGNHFAVNKETSLLQLNLVRRYPIYRNKIRNISFDLYGKIGLGPILINPDIQIDGNKNKPGFSPSGGWNEDAAIGCRLTLLRHVYIEVLAKYDNAKLLNENIYDGYAQQSLTTFTTNINLGILLPTTHYNPLFRKGEKPKRGLPTGPEPRGDLDTMKNKDQIIEGF